MVGFGGESGRFSRRTRPLAANCEIVLSTDANATRNEISVKRKQAFGRGQRVHLSAVQSRQIIHSLVKNVFKMHKEQHTSVFAA
jgi:hypothetical protein